MTPYTTLPLHPIDLSNPGANDREGAFVLCHPYDDLPVPSLPELARRSLVDRLSEDCHHSARVIDGLAFRIMSHLRPPADEASNQLDRRLPLGPLTLKDLLLSRGMILSEADRQALTAVERAPAGPSAVFRSLPLQLPQHRDQHRARHHG